MKKNIYLPKQDFDLAVLITDLLPPALQVFYKVTFLWFIVIDDFFLEQEIIILSIDSLLQTYNFSLKKVSHFCVGDALLKYILKFFFLVQNMVIVYFIFPCQVIFELYNFLCFLLKQILEKC